MSNSKPVFFELPVLHESIRYHTRAVLESIPLVVHLWLEFADGSVKQFYCCDDSILPEHYWVEEHQGKTAWSASVSRALAKIPANRFRMLLERSERAPNEMPDEPDF